MGVGEGVGIRFIYYISCFVIDRKFVVFDNGGLDEFYLSIYFVGLKELDGIKKMGWDWGG